MNPDLVRKGLIAAGMMNVGGVLIFSRGFTNAAINNADPIVMSNFGLLMIAVWGFAYLATSTIRSGAKWIVGAFAVEKLVYVVAWIIWLSNNSLTQLYSEDAFAGVFYGIYGFNDFVFMLFFVWVFLSRRTNH